MRRDEEKEVEKRKRAEVPAAGLTSGTSSCTFAWRGGGERKREIVRLGLSFLPCNQCVGQEHTSKQTQFHAKPTHSTHSRIQNG